MYVHNIPNPPQELLDQCVQVILGDPVKPHLIKKWARENCSSYVWMELLDVSDVSYKYDICCAFYFGDKKDALMFQLRWA